MAESKERRTGQGLLLTSTLLWLLGGLGVSGAASIGVPMLVHHHASGVVFAGVLLLVGVVQCVCGYGIRKRHRATAIAALTTSGLVVLLGIISISPKWVFVFNLLIIVLIVMNWKQLEPS